MCCSKTRLFGAIGIMLVCLGFSAFVLTNVARAQCTNDKCKYMKQFAVDLGGGIYAGGLYTQWDCYVCASQGGCKGGTDYGMPCVASTVYTQQLQGTTSPTLMCALPPGGYTQATNGKASGNPVAAGKARVCADIGASGSWTTDPLAASGS
jgi:hypothetical protein